MIAFFKQGLKDVQKKINNLLSAIEQGIITSSTKKRMDDLEELRTDIEQKIAIEKIKKPLLSEERIIYWLQSFKSGDVENKEYQRKIINTLVNTVYLYDNGIGKDRKIVITFNLSGDNVVTLTGSDIERYAP